MQEIFPIVTVKRVSATPRVSFNCQKYQLLVRIQIWNTAEEQIESCAAACQRAKWRERIWRNNIRFTPGWLRRRVGFVSFGNSKQIGKFAAKIAVRRSQRFRRVGSVGLQKLWCIFFATAGKWIGIRRLAAVSAIYSLQQLSCFNQSQDKRPKCFRPSTNQVVELAIEHHSRHFETRRIFGWKSYQRLIFW